MRIKHIRFNFLAVSVLIGLLFGLSSYGQTASVSDLQALVSKLQAQIQALQQQVNTLQAELGKEPEKAAPAGLPAPSGETPTPSSAPETTPPELTRSLSRGSSGDDVRKLQEFLSKDKDIYPNGLITGFFGPLTESAVKKWQEKHGIEGVGIVGPKTLSKFQDIGRGVVQGLFQQGAGSSGIIPPGLLIAPGIQSQLAIATSTVIATTSVQVASTTPSETVPAAPAVPATPAAPSSGVGTVAVPAAPATSAVPAQTTTTSTATTTTTTTTVTTAVPPTPTNPAVNVYYDNVGKWYYGVFSFLDSPHSVYDGSWGNKIYRNGILIKDRKIYNIEPNFYTYSHYDTNLPLGTTFTYTVATYNPSGTSAQSSPVSITTPSTISSDTTPPSVPTNLVATVVSSTQVNFSWSASTDNVGVSGYRVYQSSIGTQVDYHLTTSKSYINLTPSTVYSYSVAAYDGAGNYSARSAAVTVTTPASTTSSDTIAPSTPTNLTASPSSTQVALSWSASTDNVGVTGYKLYRNGNFIALPLTTSYLDYGSDYPLSPSTIYTYTVAAYDAAGNVSAQSSPVSVTTSASCSTVDTTAPSTPTNLTASPSATQITLSWTASTDNVGVTGYQFHRNGVLDATTNLNTGYVVYGLQPSTTYTFAIVAYDVAGNTSNRATILATTLADTTPPTVSNISVTNITSTGATISWTSNEPSTSRVEYSATDQGVICWNSSCPIVIFNTSLATSHSGTLSGLQPNTTYYFRAKSVDAAGNVGGSLSQFTTSPASTSATTSAVSSDRDLASVLKSLSSVLQKLQEALKK